MFSVKFVVFLQYTTAERRRRKSRIRL